MLTEEDSGVSDEVLIDATEIVTAIMVARVLETSRVAPLFQKDGRRMTDKISRIGRTEGMMREEMRRAKNQRLKPSNRNYNTTDFEEMEVQRIRRGDCSNRMASSDQIW